MPGNIRDMSVQQDCADRKTAATLMEWTVATVPSCLVHCCAVQWSEILNDKLLNFSQLKGKRDHYHTIYH